MASRPGTDSLPTLNVVGCGRAAGSLVRLWLQAGVAQIGALLNRSQLSTQRAAQRIGEGAVAHGIEHMPPADYWLIGTGDDQIATVAKGLAAVRDDLEGNLVFHLAGRFGLDVLMPLQERGAHLAAMHPVRSLTHNHLTLAAFQGTACVAEGSSAALARLQPLVEAIGGRWLPVRDIDRGLYHAAVSILSNVTKGVAWKAQNWMTGAGLPAATAAAVAHQLLATTMEDLFRSGARQSITGPVVRGDTRTIEAHLDALQDSYSADIDVYRVLARTVLELAEERGDLDAATLARFDTLLRR
jgi:predicted short-subunit dehydrogenase-like oxidoreductase (DUF2520 family)